MLKCLETSIIIPEPTHCPANEVPAARGIIDSFSFKQKEIINEGLLKHERVEKVVILNEPWTVDNGKLTPTLKLKRHNIEKDLTPFFTKWFQDKEPIVWQS